MKAWITRDRSKGLYLFTNKPLNVNGCFVSFDYVEKGFKFMELNNYDFPEVTYENSPMEVDIEINGKERCVCPDCKGYGDRISHFLGITSLGLGYLYQFFVGGIRCKRCKGSGYIIRERKIMEGKE